MGIINQFLNGVNHWKSMAIEIVDFPMFPLKMVIFPWIAWRIFPVTTNFRNLRLPSSGDGRASFHRLSRCRLSSLSSTWSCGSDVSNRGCGDWSKPMMKPIYSIDLLFQLIPYFGGIMNSIYKLYKGVVHQITALTDTRKNSMNNPGNVRLVSCQSGSAGRTAPI